mgnify:CR=1 FL=1
MSDSLVLSVWLWEIIGGNAHLQQRSQWLYLLVDPPGSRIMISQHPRSVKQNKPSEVPLLFDLIQLLSRFPLIRPVERNNHGYSDFPIVPQPYDVLESCSMSSLAVWPWYSSNRSNSTQHQGLSFPCMRCPDCLCVSPDISSLTWACSEEGSI